MTCDNTNNNQPKPHDFNVLNENISHITLVVVCCCYAILLYCLCLQYFVLYFVVVHYKKLITIMKWEKKVIWIEVI